MKIFHNPRCSKSRQTLSLIQEAGVEPEVVEYLKTALSFAELDHILNLLGMQPEELLRKKEALYQELQLESASHSREELIQVMLDHPKLMERPLVVSGNRAIIGRPPENVNSLL